MRGVDEVSGGYFLGVDWVYGYLVWEFDLSILKEYLENGVEYIIKLNYFYLVFGKVKGI